MPCLTLYVLGLAQTFKNFRSDFRIQFSIATSILSAIPLLKKLKKLKIILNRVRYVAPSIFTQSDPLSHARDSKPTAPSSSLNTRTFKHVSWRCTRGSTHVSPYFLPIDSQFLPIFSLFLPISSLFLPYDFHSSSLLLCRLYCFPISSFLPYYSLTLPTEQARAKLNTPHPHTTPHSLTHLTSPTKHTSLHPGTLVRPTQSKK